MNPLFILFAFLVGIAHSAPWSGLPAGKVIFGQSAPFSGGSWEPAPAFNLGLLGAFHEVNAKGGVNGRQLEVLSLDDQYNKTKTALNTQQLVDNPDVFAILATMGSATSVAAMNIAAPAGIPLLGPLTGALAFRQPFQERVINLRASYIDESMAWVRLMVSELQFKRISLIFIDDICCQPARDAIVAAMKNMKLELSSIHPYKTSDYANIDFDQFAADVWQYRPQGIMMFAVTGFNNQFLEAMHKIQTYPITYVTGSYVGDGNLDYLKAHPHLDQKHWFTTQISPHPMSDTPLTKKYRAAMIARSGPSVRFDFLSLEGYLVGRLVIEALKRTPVLTRDNFIEAIYSTKLFSIDDLLAGPYSNDCVHDPGTAVGQSSLCNCNTGLRFVSVTGINDKYEHTDAGVSLVYPMTECSATKNSVTRPILLSSLYPTTSSEQLKTTADRLRIGMGLDKNLNAIAKALPVDTSVANATAKTLETFSNNHPLLGSISGMSTTTKTSLPVFPTYGKLPVHDREFHRETIHLFATIQQQIYVTSKHILEQTANLPIHVLLSEAASAVTADDGVTLRKMFENSFESHRLSGVNYRTFTASTLSAELAGVPSRANLVIYGITTPEEMGLVLDALDSSQIEAFMAFNEMMEQTSVLDERYPVVNGPNATSNNVPLRIHAATNLPMWTGKGSFALKYQQMMKDANLEANITDPAIFVGYFTARVLEFMITRTNGDASPSAFMDELYRTSVVSMDGMSLGPFIAEQCTNEDCLCNSGSRVVELQTVSGYRYGTPPHEATRFSKCQVQYQLLPPVEVSHTTAIAVGVAVPTVVIGALIVAGVFISRHLKVANAPKEVTKFHTMFVQLKKETLLWERHGHSMPQLMKDYHKMVNEAVKKNKCYVVKHIGGATLVTANSAEQILGCAADVARAVQGRDWTNLISEMHRETRSTKLKGASENSNMTSQSSHHAKPQADRSHRSDGKTSFSRRSRSRSKDYSHNSHHDADSVNFSIGVHYDSGIITYHEDRHSYDYSGPAVDGAAVAADKAHGDQVLITNKVSQDAFSGSFIEFCTSDWGKGIVFHQFNVPGTTVRSFSADDIDNEANVDSIAAALEQQSAGVTKKRVILVSIFLNSIQEKSTSMPHSTFARHLVAKLEEIRSIVKEQKGHIHSIVGPRITISFNAVSPTPQATMRACHVIELIKELESKDNCTISAGMASETSLVGSFQVEDWKVDTINSKVGETAALLQHMCDTYSETYCLAQHALYDELNCFTIVEFVDLVRLPDTAKPRLLISLHGFKDEQDNDEWMYELENAAAGNPYFGVNEIFDKASHDGEVLEALQKRLAALPPEAHDFAGYHNVAKLVECLGKKPDDRNAAIDMYLDGAMKKI